MAFSDTVRVIQTGSRRLKIFVDFWNVVISARQQTNKLEIEIKWGDLAAQIVSETRQDYHDDAPGTLAGCYIFGSYLKSNSNQRAFVDYTLDKYGSLPGLFFTFAERVKKETLAKCSQCGHKDRQFAESGVDVILTVEMIKHSAMREHEYLALISSDRDFIPLLSYLKDQGQRVLHVATQKPNREMRSLTWKQIDLTQMYYGLCSIKWDQDKYVIFTAPTLDALTNEAKMILDRQGRAYEVIDLSDPHSISDKDVDFLLSNQRVMFHKKGQANTNLAFSYAKLCDSIRELRGALRTGEVVGNTLPYVMHCGSLYAMRAEPQYGAGTRWLVSSNTEEMEPWREPQPPVAPA